MLTLEQALRRSAAVTLGLLAAAGTAAAQGTPGTGDTPTGSDPMQPDPYPTDPMQAPPDPDLERPVIETTEPVDVDINVVPPPPPPQPMYTAPTYTATDPDDYDMDRSGSTLERYGVAVSLGGGVEDFTNETMRGTTDLGGRWDVRVALGTRSPIGFEASYIGSAQGIDALGLDDDAILISNGVQGNVRVNLLDANIQPFAIAGIGWRRYSLARADFNTSAVSGEDDVLEVPLGAGLAWKYRGFLLDARGEYRFAQYADMVPSLQNEAEAANMHRWSVNANIGYAF